MSALVGFALDAAQPTTIANGQDQCDYSGTDSSLSVIIYQPNSGVDWARLTEDSGADTSVSGVGDRAATDNAIEIDVQAGTRLIAVQSGGETVRLAVAKAFVAALQ